MNINRNILYVTCIVCLSIKTIVLCKNVTAQPKRVCVIGAGIAGLASARYLQEEGINFTVLEATKYVGGTWRYDPRVGTDENGLPLYTSMYRDLRTNLPRQAMEFSGYQTSDALPSFPSWNHYYDYVKSFAKDFDLEKHIKFLHLVILVRREGNNWIVKFKNIISGEEFLEVFDYVFVCTGHYSKPHLPDLPAEKLFKGTIIHSHDYKVPEPYKDRRVVIVGSGPSGMDIAVALTGISKSVIHSQHTVVNFKTPFPSNYRKRPDIKNFTETGVVFADETFEEVDDVIYCTGFQYYYPFLDKSSGLTFTPHSVIPLYQYMVNIHHPSMILMGLVVRACVVAAIDAQARYATALVKGNFTLPSEEDMMREWQRRANAVEAKGRPMSDIHLLAEKEDQYYEAIANESGTARVPPVLFKMRAVDTQAKLENLYNYRNYEYRVLDENTFTRRYIDPKGNGSCSP